MSEKNITNINIINRLKEIQEIGHLTDREILWLLTPKRISYAKLEVGGERLPAWRVLFNDVLGPGKGGIRFHPEVSENEVTSLGFWMMIKNSLAELPFGGAKGGVRFNPKSASPKMLEEVSRKYVDAFYKVLGQDIDVPAPDVYTNSQIMAWMLDEYEKKINRHEPGMITDKPLELQGCILRDEATGKGGFFIITEMIRELKMDKKRLTIAVQGFGNVGLNLSKILYGDGFKIVAVSDSRGGIYNKTGLNIEQIIRVKARTDSLIDFPDGQKIDNRKLLELPVDILILAALENQITQENAGDIQARYVVEMANGPTTYQADKILSNRKIVVVPDVLANAGGVIGSYFEWSQNKTGNILDKEYLRELLQRKMIYSWRKVRLMQEEHKSQKVNLRTAAYLIAIEKILKAGKLRGSLK